MAAVPALEKEAPVVDVVVVALVCCAFVCSASWKRRRDSETKRVGHEIASFEMFVVETVVSPGHIVSCCVFLTGIFYLVGIFTVFTVMTFGFSVSTSKHL